MNPAFTMTADAVMPCLPYSRKEIRLRWFLAESLYATAVRRDVVLLNAQLPVYARKHSLHARSLIVLQSR
jgi:hypothetical protein